MVLWPKSNTRHRQHMVLNSCNHLCGMHLLLVCIVPIPCVAQRVLCYTVEQSLACLQDLVNSSTMTVNVRQCMPGEVPGNSSVLFSTCNRCLPGQYSFNPTNTTCDVCPGDASTVNCTSTAEMLSKEGHWHSGPQATMIHACPNPDACQ